MGLFNFRPSVRPVPLEVHIQGFPGQHYCPRMASMNKPAFQGKQPKLEPFIIYKRKKGSSHVFTVCLRLMYYMITECVTIFFLGVYRMNLLLMTQNLIISNI